MIDKVKLLLGLVLIILLISYVIVCSRFMASKPAKSSCLYFDKYSA